ncbi:MAG: hypothetical protein EA392_04755 [Cryomorphaceae bacterium]|nr:MAG: hypothetical protein EA392_04755 [Cryomorphaceae bacterium]
MLWANIARKNGCNSAIVNGCNRNEKIPSNRTGFLRQGMAYLLREKAGDAEPCQKQGNTYAENFVAAYVALLGCPTCCSCFHGSLRFNV